MPNLLGLATEWPIVAVATRPPAPRGRTRQLTPSPVAVVAVGRGLPVLNVARFDADAVAAIAATKPDLGVIVAFGGLVPPALLAVPRHGWLNLHFSLLPAWRGAAPVQRAIIAGETRIGASVFRLTERLDDGDVYATLTHDLGPEDTAADALDALAHRGAECTAAVVRAIAAGTAVAHPQEGVPTMAAKLTLADGRLDWSAPARVVHARARGVTPEPGAHTRFRDEPLKIHALRLSTTGVRLEPGVVDRVGGAVLVGTGTEPLELVSVQPSGRRVMPAADWWRGLAADAGPVRFV